MDSNTKYNLILITHFSCTGEYQTVVWFYQNSHNVRWAAVKWLYLQPLYPGLIVEHTAASSIIPSVTVLGVECLDGGVAGDLELGQGTKKVLYDIIIW